MYTVLAGLLLLFTGIGLYAFSEHVFGPDADFCRRCRMKTEAKIVDIEYRPTAVQGDVFAGGMAVHAVYEFTAETGHVRTVSSVAESGVETMVGSTVVIAYDPNAPEDVLPEGALNGKILMHNVGRILAVFCFCTGAIVFVSAFL